MKFTVGPAITDITERQRKKQISTENGDLISVYITAKSYGDESKRELEFTDCYTLESWTRNNHNGGKITETECTKQIGEARVEYEDRLKEKKEEKKQEGHYNRPGGHTVYADRLD